MGWAGEPRPYNVNTGMRDPDYHICEPNASSNSVFQKQNPLHTYTCLGNYVKHATLLRQEQSECLTTSLASYPAICQRPTWHGHS